MVRSPIFASVVSLSLAFNNPAGHELLNQTGLRIAFLPEWTAAMKLTGRWMPFEEFKQNAPLYLMIYRDSDQVKVERDIKRLGALSALCLTSTEEGGDPTTPKSPSNIPCHAICSDERKRKKKGQEPVI